MLAVTVGGVAAPARAQLTQTLTPSDDTFINSRFSGNNNGASLSFFSGVESQGGIMHGLVRFTMPPLLVGRVTLTDAQLKLVLAGVGTAGSTNAGTAATHNISVLGVNWNEGTGLGNSQGNGSGGPSTTTGTGFVIGQACTGTGASWDNAMCTSGSAWAGGSGTLSASASTAGLAVGSTLTFDSGACSPSGGGAMCSHVQGWLDGTLSNFGWLITDSNVTKGQMQRFVSKEGGSAPTLALSYTCKTGFAPSGNNCTTCTTAANTACITSHTSPTPNTCVDDGAGKTTYHCTCDTSVYRSTGGTSCIIGCSPTNHCRDNGDGAAVCADTASGYSCTCDTGFLFNGTSCVSACPAPVGQPDPCGTGGTCTAVAGGWTCNCSAGYVSTGAPHPACTNYNACIAAANTDCNIGFSGNLCVDEAPPSVTYHCSCGNADFVVGTGSDNGSACVQKNFCSPNHCIDGGDNGASCANRTLGTTGYDCTCSSNLWVLGMVNGNASCVDNNECAGINPCGAGVCTNVPAGGGYTCACNGGYVSTARPTPLCVRDFCALGGNDACLVAKSGNLCVNQKKGYVCQCGNAAYAASPDGQRCVLKTACAVNHCTDDGDVAATCTDRIAPPAGYDCDCGPGWQFDGITCREVNACASNPCGNGVCSNMQGGGYQCTCPDGYTSTGGLMPTCVATVGSYTVKATHGGCAIAGTHADDDAAAAVWLFAGLLLALRGYCARRPRTARARR